MLRRAAPIAANYSQGDMVMYRHDNPEHGWQGPARILGFVDETVWCLHLGVPVSASKNRLRPANASEILAYMVVSRGHFPQRVPEAASGSQQGFLDVPGTRRGDGEEEAAERPAQRRRLTQDQPESELESEVRRTTGVTTPVITFDGEQDEQVEPEPPIEETPLERAWKRNRSEAPEDPGQALMRSLRESFGSAASSAANVSR